MRRFLKVIFLITLSAFLMLSTAFAGSTQLILNVNGLACPFCAYGLEKKIKKMDGFESYDADLKKGEVYVGLQKNTKINIDAIKKAVREAGFTLIKISQKTNTELKILYSSRKGK